MTFPEPADVPATRPFWSALREGRLLYQHCRRCGTAWLPGRDACPACLAPAPEWLGSAGRAVVVSWIVYHTAYDAAFAGRLPYDVTLVELDEGPRLLTNVVDSEAGARLSLGARVRLQIETEGDLPLPRFRLEPG
jgi:uncharacterized OB-fold protein